MEKKRTKWHNRTQDLTGKRFERLKVLDFAGREEVTGRALWNCVCDCKNTLVVNGNRLLSGNVKSCGCLKRDSCINRSTLHGDTDKPLWLMWTHMKQRCDYPKNISYKYYGGRGITYDPSWSDYLNFKKDMSLLYAMAYRKWGKKFKLSIERLNVNGNYCKANCTFIPKQWQSKNTRTNKWFLAINPKGRKYFSRNQKEFAEIHGLSRSGIYHCLKKNWEHTGGWKFFPITVVSTSRT
jgi:hypothetical protein